MSEERFLELQYKYLALKISHLKRKAQNKYLSKWSKLHASELREFYFFMKENDDGKDKD